jgi:hypothetical protein
MWLLQPRREQICTIPPARTIMGTIGASQTAQFHAPMSSAWQWGQKKLTTVPNGISFPDSIV